MPKILLKFRDDVLQEIPIDKSCMVIGRTGENDIVINNLGVSRQHAKIIQEGDDFMLEDLGSRNGTLLNDEDIKKSKLQDKDEIVIGKHKLIFMLYEDSTPVKKVSHEVTTPHPSSLPPDETLKLRVPKTQPIPKMDAEEEEKPQADERQVGVEILEGADKVKVITFTRLLIVAGKGPTVDIPIKGDYKKDVVFVISNRPAGFFISPAKDKNITLKVNGQESSDYIKLEDGAIIDIAETKLKFFMRTME